VPWPPRNATRDTPTSRRPRAQIAKFQAHFDSTYIAAEIAAARADLGATIAAFKSGEKVGRPPQAVSQLAATKAVALFKKKFPTADVSALEAELGEA
jgi:hypothetical protein